MRYFRHINQVLNALEHDRFYRSVDMMRMLYWQQCERLCIPDDTMLALCQHRAIQGKHLQETYINAFVDTIFIEETGVDKFLSSRYLPDGDRVDVDTLRNIFRELRFPLPVAIFPGAPDNTDAFVALAKPVDIDFGPTENSLDEIRGMVGELNATSANSTAEQSAIVPIIDEAQALAQGHEMLQNCSTQKQLINVAEDLLKSGKLGDKQRKYILAFKYHKTPNLSWDRAYQQIPGTSRLSKNKATQERNFYLWAAKGEKFCQEHASQ